MFTSRLLLDVAHINPLNDTLVSGGTASHYDGAPMPRTAITQITNLEAERRLQVPNQ